MIIVKEVLVIFFTYENSYSKVSFVLQLFEIEYY